MSSASTTEPAPAAPPAGALRTPDERFHALPGWPWAPRWWAHEGHRVHFVDEGAHDAPATVLCLHGNPTWSYLYRKMIPVFLAAGLRVIAPDLIGFGRSDKPAADAWHTYDRHRQMLLAFVREHALRDVLLVVQDWGGLFGLTLPHELPGTFTRLLVMNTGLPTGRVSEGFRAWREFSSANPDLAVGRLLRRGKPDLTAEEAAAYDAPFPDASFKAALRAFPNLVPDTGLHGAEAPGIAHGRRAGAFWRDEWAGQSFMAVGAQDPVLGPPVMEALAALIRGCPEPMVVAEGGHFVQEWGAPIAEAALARFGLAPARAAVV
jgi:pimeloyl-ACP methyl ester carboxylesterase